MLVIFLFIFTLSSFSHAGTEFETKTKVRLVENGVWLETEIAPPALLMAVPEADKNSDGRLEEDDLSSNRSLILLYYAQRIKLVADDKWLQADSTYFAFRSPAAPAAIPDRFYIYHWYAMLRRPKRLQLENHLFEESKAGYAHQGAIIDGDKILKFDFPQRETAAQAHESGAVVFQLDKSGDIAVLESDTSVMQAGYLWLGLGLGGLLALRMASSMRSKWLLRRKAADSEQDSEEVEMEESAVFS
ncbi:MAG: hypothetical protein ACREOO_07990 [bacterium]